MHLHNGHCPPVHWAGKLEKLQLPPALTDFKGPTTFICYTRISFIANIESEEKLFKGLKLRRGSVIDGFPLLTGPL